MLRERAPQLHGLILVTDIAVAGTAFGATLLLGPGAALLGDVARESIVFLGLAGVLAWPLVLEQMAFYRSNRRRRLGTIVRRLGLAAGVVTALSAAGGLLLGIPLSAAFHLANGAAQFLALVALHTAVFGGLRALRRRGRNFRNVLIVGTGRQARRLRERIERHPEWGMRVLAHLDQAKEAVDPQLAHEKILGFEEFPGLLRETVVDEVLVACPRAMLATLEPVVRVCAGTGIPLLLIPDLFGDFMAPPRAGGFHSSTALCFAPVHHRRSRLLLKRALDMAGALLLMLVFSPLVAAAALLIRASSPGPVFFHQARCGLNGRRFEIWKLRTMYLDAEARRAGLQARNEMDGPVFKLADDPRATPVGRFLRRWSIDEIPQLWNVLKGDMSLVGPRPPLPAEVVQYELAHRRRLAMRPGITCIWQVSGRNTIGFADWVRLDIEYIETWSLAKDLKLLLRTIPAVVRGTGAS